MFDLLPFKRDRNLPDVFSEMENTLRKMWYGFPFQDLSLATDEAMPWTPRLDVSETDTSVEVKADLPGLDKKDIDVSLDKDLLIIKGERKQEKEESGKHFHSIERRYGSFYRSLRLPAEVKTDKIEANFKDGVLKITLPKTEEAKKKIEHIQIK